jgi:hypothetical protein
MYNLETLRRYVLVPVTRSPLVRFLVVVLALALALSNGSAHAALHWGAAHSEPCPEEHAHHHGGTSPHHQHQPNKGLACCCDCLGCSAAVYIPPGLSATPTEFASRIQYDAFTTSFSSRTVLPEPDPPRPGTLS